MFITYLMLAVSGLLGSVIAWDDLSHDGPESPDEG